MDVSSNQLGQPAELSFSINNQIIDFQVLKIMTPKKMICSHCSLNPSLDTSRITGRTISKHNFWKVWSISPKSIKEYTD